MDPSDGVYSLGIDDARQLRSNHELLFSLLTSRVRNVVLAVVNDADYLLMAKPVAVNHLGIRRDCATSVEMLLVAGSSL